MQCGAAPMLHSCARPVGMSTSHRRSPLCLRLKTRHRIQDGTCSGIISAALKIAPHRPPCIHPGTGAAQSGGDALGKQVSKRPPVARCTSHAARHGAAARPLLARTFILQQRGAPAPMPMRRQRDLARGALIRCAPEQALHSLHQLCGTWAGAAQASPAQAVPLPPLLLPSPCHRLCPYPATHSGCCRSCDHCCCLHAAQPLPLPLRASAIALSCRRYRAETPPRTPEAASDAEEESDEEAHLDRDDRHDREERDEGRPQAHEARESAVAHHQARKEQPGRNVHERKDHC